MTAKARSNACSTTASTESQASTQPLAAREKPGAECASELESSHKAAHYNDAELETPAESKLFARLPLELFIEIASYLHPCKLILLSRVNKLFRGVLMSRSVVKVWRSSLGTVEGLPPCPDDLCEPKYAALLFVGECSICGVVTSRKMNPVLRVRLCAECIKKHVIGVSAFSFPKIHVVSASIIPAKLGEAQEGWCLYSEAQDVETEYTAFLDASLDGDRQELNRWCAERLEYVKKRYREARTLAQWAVGKELDGFKSARKAEIEARLLELGWERIDFQQEEPQRQRQWTSLVYNAKPLDDQVWKELSPRLIEHLERNRSSRLKREAHRRRSLRRHRLYEYMSSLQDQLKPLVQATLKLQSTNKARTSTSAGTLPSNCRYPYLRRCKMALFPMSPGTDLYFCPESTALRETDMSMEAFELEFPAKKVQLAQIIDERRRALELLLFEMLPNDIQPVDSQGTDYDLLAGADEDAQSLDCLTLAMRKLLRADVTFKAGISLYFYPSDFQYWHQYADNISYDLDSSLIAQALLRTLGRPNTSYLEMDALGKSFLCGRCNCEPVYYTWKSMISHYRSEASEWRMQSEHVRVARGVQNGKAVTLIFTHDTSRTDRDKPLVRLVHEWTNPCGSGIIHKYQTCQLCDSVGISGTYEGGYIIDHVRDVHLIDDPMEGVHYQPVNS